MAVDVAIAGDLAIVTIDNPPINASSQTVRAGLMAALGETENSKGVRAVVLRAAGRTFTAGADVREFGEPPVEPHLPDVVNAIEAASKPWIAALHGTVLGGGLEIALACSHRVAHPKTKLGFPEVNLGLIPGAGGTVRLPRLVDPGIALEMIVGGKSISATRAHQIGLVDEVAGPSLDESAIALAQSASKPLALLDRPLKALPADWDQKKEKVLAKSGRLHAPKCAVEVLEFALSNVPQDALARERVTFLDLKDDPQSTALRHIFFAERASAHVPQIKGVTPRGINSAGVVGGGTMGAGIVAALLLAGLPVTLIEVNEDAKAAGDGRVSAILQSSRARGLISADKYDSLMEGYGSSTDYAVLAEVDLVIEAVFEDMDVKKDVIAKIEAAVSARAIVASNTSYLDLNEMAASAKVPERIIGLHFFSPAHIMKLVEVVVPDAAAPEVTASAFALAKRMRKIAVQTGVCDGFIGNRIMSAYRRAIEFLVEDGVSPYDVDAAMRDYGYPMGLFEMQDMAGLDISWATRKRQAATRDPAAPYFAVGDLLCEAGRFGRKNGAGWYDYDTVKPEPSSAVLDIVASERARKGIRPRDASADEIMNVLLTALTDEADSILSEGIARKPSDIDVVMVNGYGFPRWRGGPLFAWGKTI